MSFEFNINLTNALCVVQHLPAAKLEHAVILAIVDAYMDENIDWVAIGNNDWYECFRINKIAFAKATSYLQENGLIYSMPCQAKKVGRSGRVQFYSTKEGKIDMPAYSGPDCNIAVFPEEENQLKLADVEDDDEDSTNPF